jgi:hypothetical protein
MNQPSAIEALLFEEEGSVLDFKSEQYPFADAAEERKSELLKDILAFANAWRGSDAFILVGVKEVKGGRSIPVGVKEQLDDAHIQQFVNSKTQRPIVFSYQATELDGLPIGVIKIPVQRRPFYLKKAYGRLLPSTVYIRRGSSTDIASIEEISTMGFDESLPANVRLAGFLIGGKDEEVVDKRLAYKALNASIPAPSSIPDYSSRKDTGPFSLLRTLEPAENSEYYRELAKYRQRIWKTKGFKFGVKNSGDTTGRDVKILIDIQDEAHGLIVCDKTALPKKPEPSYSLLPHIRTIHDPVDDIDVLSTPSGYRVIVSIGKVQPKAFIVSTDALYVSASQSCVVKMAAKIFSDDLPEPAIEEFEIEFEATQRAFDVNELLPEAR